MASLALRPSALRRPLAARATRQPSLRQPLSALQAASPASKQQPRRARPLRRSAVPGRASGPSETDPLQKGPGEAVPDSLRGFLEAMRSSGSLSEQPGERGIPEELYDAQLFDLATKDSAAVEAAAADPEVLARMVLKMGSEHELVQLTAVNALGCVAAHSPSGLAAVAALPGFLASLQRMLASSSNPMVLSAAITVVARLAVNSPASQAAMAATPGFLQALVSQLGSSLAVVQGLAAEALNVFATDSPAHAAAIGAVPGCIPALVTLVRAGRAPTQRPAAMLLFKLVVGDGLQANTAVPDCVPALASLLMFERTQLAAAWTLIHLVEDDSEQQEALAAALGAFAALARLLAGDNTEAKEPALWILDALAEDNREAILAEPLIKPALVDLLRTGEDAGMFLALLPEAAAHLIYSLADGSPEAQAVIGAEPGVLQSLADLLGKPGGGNAPLALRTLAHNPANHEAISLLVTDPVMLEDILP